MANNRGIAGSLCDSLPGGSVKNFLFLALDKICWKLIAIQRLRSTDLNDSLGAVVVHHLRADSIDGGSAAGEVQVVPFDGVLGHVSLVRLTVTYKDMNCF